LTSLLARVRTFCLPAGQDAARRVRTIRVTEQGKMRPAPNAAWISFTSQMEIDSTRSRFRWEARFGGGRLRIFHVTDAYEDGRGEVSVKIGGIIPARKIAGPEADLGELQRYLASMPLCPPMLVNHPSLAWSELGLSTLRVEDAGATVEIEVDPLGCPCECRAVRPRALGKDMVMTPWSASAADFREVEGMRIAHVLEAAWRPPEGAFTYYRTEVASIIMKPDL
jgi:hypothetical protein